MQLSMLAPVQTTSGRVFGRKGAACTRTINGKTYSYTWPENYNYPVIFNRAKQNLLLRMAQQESNLIYSNPEQYEQCKQAFVANPGKYRTLKGFIFGLCHARAAQKITDELVHDEMQRQLSAASRK